jgi:hypothetical protein
MLFGAVYFDLLTEQYQAVTMIDNLIEGLKTAKQLAAKNELRIGVGGLIENEYDDLHLGIGGNWCVDTTDVYFLKRSEAIELDRNWHVLDHKHPQFLSPAFQEEADAKRIVDVWNGPPSL